MLQIERNVIGIPSQKENDLAEGVRVANFIEDVWIPARHVGHHNVSLADLIEYPVEHPLGEDLLIEPFSVGSNVVSRTLDAKLVYVVEVGLDRHQNEDKGLG